jgi:hypothetical protein
MALSCQRCRAEWSKSRSPQYRRHCGRTSQSSPVLSLVPQGSTYDGFVGSALQARTTTPRRTTRRSPRHCSTTESSRRRRLRASSVRRSPIDPTAVSWRCAVQQCCAVVAGGCVATAVHAMLCFRILHWALPTCAAIASSDGSDSSIPFRPYCTISRLQTRADCIAAQVRRELGERKNMSRDPREWTNSEAK